jgi:acetylornithine/LysW-gamma-L-lysine aminotransferase
MERLKDIYALERQHTSGVYAKRPTAFVRGEGAVLWDAEGNAYIDCAAGHGVANLGHAHPEVARAISEQAARLITCPETFHNDRRAAYIEKLTGLVPDLDRVFLCNSGTEAVEAALKFARLSTQRRGIVAAMRGFHGRTLGALSATWDNRYKTPFLPLVPGFTHVPYNKVDSLAKAVTDDTAAVILEIVQGEGGVRPGTAEYFSVAQDICRDSGALLIVDEVQTGFGRTGKMFAFEHYDMQPDLVCLAKSIAGGMPMGAVLIAPKIQRLAPGLHGSTFGGNPLACAAGLATLEALERQHLAGEAARKGNWLLNQLKQIQSPLIREVRGLGLMIGIELKRKVAPYLREMFSRRVIALPAGLTVIRLLPPLVITDQQLQQAVSVIEETLIGNG